MMPDSTYNMAPPTCQCGCGKEVAHHTRNRLDRGVKKGDPHLYAPGHAHRVYLAEDERGTKTCSLCREAKPYDAFDHNKRTPDGYHLWCKGCRTIESQKRWASRTPAQIEKDRITAEARIGRNKEAVRKRLGTGCVDCGEADPVVLEFDHVRGEKLANVSRLIRSGGYNKLVAEMDKCEVVCANCHRRRTTLTFDYWKGDSDF